MKFCKSLMLPVLAFSLLQTAACFAQDAAASSDAPTEVKRVTTPYKLQAVGDSPCEKPQLSLPVMEGDVKPWTDAGLHNNPQNFQFAIVTDRNGGMRPEIFKTAIKKLNILQPEFVMCIGDLIHGYTHDPDALKAMWIDFENVISKLQMRFFYVVGNHDISNPLQREEWYRRFGTGYYHFLYGDVLFLCVNTEDEAASMISEEQVEYFRKVLEQNKDVRWTMVFMHKPLWTSGLRSLSSDNEKDLKALKQSRWYDMEQLLKDRQYTVYSGHVHQYTQYLRNGHEYYTLATTGGGSSLRGAKGYGTFDQVTWITMTDNGPIMANLSLDGIMPNDLRVEEEALLVRKVHAAAVRAEVTVTDPLPFNNATLTVHLNNPTTLPLTLKINAPAGKLKFEPKSMSVTLAAGEKKDVQFALDGSRVKKLSELNGLALDWTGSFDLKDRPNLKLKERAELQFDTKYIVSLAKDKIAIDGDVSEWKPLWSAQQRFQQVVGKKHAWGGYDDVTFQYATQYDNKNVYLAIQVKDDDVLAKSTNGHKMVDALVVSMLPEGAVEGDSDSSVRVVAHPAESGAGKIKSSTDDVNAACVTTKTGYQFEMSIPAADLSNAGGEWKNFRLNVRINDEDEYRDSRKAKLWWKPKWGDKDSYPNSGTFVRGE